MRTQTGNFPIGFRRIAGSAWQKDLYSVAAWAAKQGFESIDFPQLISPGYVSLLNEHGLRLGSADLIECGEIATPDLARRRQLVATNQTYIGAASRLGARIFFTIVGGEGDRSRAENYRAAVDAFGPLAEVAAAVGAHLAIEGYPGKAPLHPLLCTTPETVRAFLKDLPRGVGLNYDPSHLIRLGVDHIRFLREFVNHVVHVHAKDTELFPEAVYEFGLHQPAAFAEPHGWGGPTWRYTLPGKGAARWSEIFQILADAGYGGLVSVELEDERYNGDTEREKAGLLQSLEFLRHA